MGLAKWLQRGLEKPETNLLLALFGSERQEASLLKAFMRVVQEIFERLGEDTKAGSLMTALLHLFKAKKESLADNKRA